ncbi:MAG: hypothetical protein GY784_00375 [Gammaproteobacteria bacterium]|nr:hypothetical protein [Gammaproteobacteria bacterium]
MLALARYTLKGPYQAAAVVGVLTVVAVFFPLLSGAALLGALVTMVLTFVSAALVGLIILTQGVQSGMKAILVSIAGITLVATVALDLPQLGLSIGLAQWLPIVVLAQTLRATSSLALTLIAGVVLGVFAVVGQFVFWTGLESDWVAIILQSIGQLPQSQTYDAAELSENISLMVHWMVLALAASVYMVFVSIVMLSRWIQARLAESDGYKREFQSLSLGKPASIVALVVLTLSFWFTQDWMTSLAILVSTAFLFQGIAVVHAKIAKSRYRQMATGVFYALLVIFPQIMAVTMLTGIVDNWFNFRKSGNIENTPG